MLRLLCTLLLLSPPAALPVDDKIGLGSWRFEGQTVEELFARSVSGLRDTNQDGFNDVAVGLPGRDLSRGMVRVYDGQDGKQRFEISGPESGDLFGLSVGAAGDVDNDSFYDLIVGAPGRGDRPGQAFVFSGKDGERLHVLSGENTGDLFGHSVSGAGDVNGDGFDDLIVGAPGFATKDGAEAGKAYVYSGKDAELLHTVTGERAGDRLGWSVSSAGDTNGDSFDDVVVGAPHAGRKKKSSEGVALVIDGKKGKELHSFSGDEDGDRFGWVVRGAGDTDGNNTSEVLVGSFKADGYARLFDGKKGKVVHTFRGEEGAYFGSVVAGSLFGRRVIIDVGSVGATGLFDVDADGMADVAIAAPGDPSIEDEAGRVLPSVSVFSGKSGELLLRLEGESRDHHFGGSLSSAGDVNDDGFADFIVGDDMFGAAKGTARIYLGSAP